MGIREIIFRGKRVDNGEWVYGYYVKVGRYGYILTGKLDVCKGRRDFEYYTVDIETVGQYTGLTDKNGKRIFEGDVLRLDKEEYIVRFGIAGFELLRKCVSTPISAWYGTDAIGDDGTLFEVIGNIHDNPEGVQ